MLGRDRDRNRAGDHARNGGAPDAADTGGDPQRAAVSAGCGEDDKRRTGRAARQTDEDTTGDVQNMMRPGFYNMDCMDALPTFPDKFFDLAIVDPPYGGGAENINEPENISGGVRHGTDRAEDSAESLTAIISAKRTGGRWAKKYQRERPGRRIYETGISRRRKSISKSLHAFRKIKSYGAETISTFRRRDALLFGEN